MWTQSFANNRGGRVQMDKTVAGGESHDFIKIGSHPARFRCEVDLSISTMVSSRFAGKGEAEKKHLVSQDQEQTY